MVYFDCDYMRGACPEVLGRLVETNMEPCPGYGADAHTRTAAEMLLKAFGLDGEPRGAVYFLNGGTQTNAVVIDRLIGRGEGVLCAETAHINVHESGAIESDGHKVIPLPTHDGKISARDITNYIGQYYADDTWEHIVRPAMVYISFPTELGTLYTLSELKEISQACAAASIPLYIDGARLPYGMAAECNDVTPEQLARLCDIFYAGGTKCGALFGEAVVTRRAELLHRFMPHVKRHGALLAKSRLLGVQFEALFTDGLYWRMGERAVKMAMRLRRGFTDHGYRLLIDSPTNQQFVILPNDVLDALRREVSFELWGPRGETETPVRFVTDWSTTQEDVDELLSRL